MRIHAAYTDQLSGRDADAAIAEADIRHRKDPKAHVRERIAQLVIIATPSITLHNTYELPESSRGAQGFGSSGLS